MDEPFLVRVIGSDEDLRGLVFDRSSPRKTTFCNALVACLDLRLRPGETSREVMAEIMAAFTGADAVICVVFNRFVAALVPVAVLDRSVSASFAVLVREGPGNEASVTIADTIACTVRSSGSDLEDLVEAFARKIRSVNPPAGDGHLLEPDDALDALSFERPPRSARFEDLVMHVGRLGRTPLEIAWSAEHAIGAHASSSCERVETVVKMLLAYHRPKGTQTSALPLRFVGRLRSRRGAFDKTGYGRQTVVWPASALERAEAVMRLSNHADEIAPHAPHLASVLRAFIAEAGAAT